MTILKRLKQQLDQFVAPEIEPLKGSQLQMYLISQPAFADDTDKGKGVLQNTVDDVPLPFQEMYKKSYSHGLEEIYAIENIDLKTIRPLSDSLTPLTPKDLLASETAIGRKTRGEVPQQYELPLGGEHVHTLPSFVLLEPIDVLDLSKHAEKCLHEQGKRVIKDLLDIDWKELLYVKGIGQGHIDEIRQKLGAYTEGISLFHCTDVNYEALVRSFLVGSDKKKSYIVLERYCLAELLALSPADNVEVRRQSNEIKESWLKEGIGQLRSDERRRLVSKGINDIMNAFVIPWMRYRCGVVRAFELMERLHQIAHSPENVDLILPLIRDIYYEDSSIFCCGLIQLEEGLFCTDAAVQEAFYKVVTTAKTYFYGDDISYTLPELIGWLLAEYAVLWDVVDERFIERVLCYSSHFRVRKGAAGALIVKLA